MLQLGDVLGSMLLPQALLMSEVHIDVHGPHCCRRPCQYPWPVLLSEVRLMSVVYAPAGDHADAHSLCYYPRLCRCLWSVLPAEARFVSVAYVAARGRVNVHGQYGCQKPGKAHDPCCH